MEGLGEPKRLLSPREISNRCYLLKKSETVIDHCDAIIAVDQTIHALRSKEFASGSEMIELQELADIVLGQSPKGSNCFDIYADGCLPLLNGPPSLVKFLSCPIHQSNNTGS